MSSIYSIRLLKSKKFTNTEVPLNLTDKPQQIKEKIHLQYKTSPNKDLHVLPSGRILIRGEVFENENQSLQEYLKQKKINDLTNIVYIV